MPWRYCAPNHHTGVGDRLLKRCEMDAWIAVRVMGEVGSRSPSVCAMSYLGIRQPGHGNAALVAEGDTCMARIRGAHGGAFRPGLPRLFKNVDPFRKPEAPPPRQITLYREADLAFAPGDRGAASRKPGAWND